MFRERESVRTARRGIKSGLSKDVNGMKPYADWTAARAVTNTEKELKQMARLAIRIRDGYGSIEDEEKFTGIFSRLLTDPIEDVRKVAGNMPSWN